YSLYYRQCFLYLRLIYLVYDFYFSSRRRHTRSKRDWSSDVCSSDLENSKDGVSVLEGPGIFLVGYGASASTIGATRAGRRAAVRSEERRVGKECSSEWVTALYKIKDKKKLRGASIKYSSKFTRITFR